MNAVKLLERCLALEPETVLDVGPGLGNHVKSFIGNGAKVTGLDVRPAEFEHENYTHIQSPYEKANLKEKFDIVWCCHTLEHVPNVQHCLIHLRNWVKPGGYLAITVPSSRQNRLHIGHLSLWTPAHLVYNMVCAGWNCKEAEWYTEYIDICLLVQKVDDIDLSWRTSLPGEIFDLNRYTPIEVRHESGAWWGNKWPEEFPASRVPDPPMVTAGYEHTNLAPELQLAYGPNPALRKPPGMA